MKQYKISELRNIGIIGHSSSGKTALTEALLYITKTTDRLGKTEEGNTVTDFDIEEKKRGISLSTSIAPIEYQNTKINLVDIPGYFDFVGEEIQGLKAVDLSIITVCGVAKVQVGTEKAWSYCNDLKMPRYFYINKLDRENSNFENTVQDLKVKFGNGVIPITYPIMNQNGIESVVDIINKKLVKYDKQSNKDEYLDIPKDLSEKIDELRQELVESVAETDEELLEKYFNDGDLSSNSS